MGGEMKREDLLFVETTIQIRKAIGSAKQIDKISARLERADNVITSSYVLMEFNRRIISDCIWLHGLIKESPLLAHLMRRIVQEGFGRQKQNTIFILSKLLEYADGPFLVDTPEFWNKLLDRLERFIDGQLHKRFSEGIDLTFPSLMNSTGCDIAYQLPTKRQAKEGKAEYVYRYTCRRKKARCRLPQLLQEHSDELLVLEQILEERGANSGLRKAFSALSQIRKHTEGWNAARGSRNCWRLGDVIITLEVPEGYTLLTTNARHFAPLCEALGKKCEILSL